MSEIIFCITFLGQPPKPWDDWFDNPMQAEAFGQGYRVHGQVRDLAEFIGILRRLQLLNLNPISIQAEQAGTVNS